MAEIPKARLITWEEVGETPSKPLIRLALRDAKRNILAMVEMPPENFVEMLEKMTNFIESQYTEIPSIDDLPADAPKH